MRLPTVYTFLLLIVCILPVAAAPVPGWNWLETLGQKIDVAGMSDKSVLTRLRLAGRLNNAERTRLRKIMKSPITSRINSRRQRS